MTYVETSITVKDEGKKLVKHYDSHSGLFMSMEDPNIQRMIRETLEEFKLDSDKEPPSIVVKSTLVIQ